MANTQLQKTFSGASNRKTFTLSFWVKRSKISSGMYLANVGNQEANPQAGIEFNGSDTFSFWNNSGSGSTKTFTTTQVFRDTSAWYHFVIAVDTTQSTQSNRVKIYVNGAQITDFGTEVYPDQNYDYEWSGTQRHTIGAYYNNQSYFDGLMTHFHFIDGTAYTPSTFGETDSTSGIWKPKPSPSVTYGTNGFFLKFENSGAMGTDSSGNSNTFTVVGSLKQNVDSPTNLFTTLNKLSTHGNNTLTFGNLRIAFTANTSYTNSIGTLGISSGRWYVEAKVAGATTYYPCIGFCSMGNMTRRYYDPLYTAAHLGADEGTGYFAHGNIQKGGSTDGDYATFTTGDIISMYLDLESGTKTMKYYKNDSLVRSTTITPVDGQFYTFGATGTSSSDIVDFNFGSGFFGTTAVASANADANGFGAFEYSPTLSGVNYYALCTKNIKEFG